MTDAQIAAFTVSNDLYMWMGIILGLILSGVFKTVRSFLLVHYQRPRRIRFRNLNGRTERKTDFEYLYLFKGEYYTLEQRDFLIKERLKNIKSISKFDVKFCVLFICMCLSFICLTIYFALSSSNFWGGL